MMNKNILVPQLPESVADAVVAGWLKQEGDFVKAEEAIVELETDKVVLEVTAPVSGVLQTIVYQTGDNVNTDEVLGVISEQAEASEYAANNEDHHQEQEPPISPSVRQSLAENDLDYHDVQGSGKKGRILKEDVEKHLAQQREDQPVVQSPPPMVNEGVDDSISNSMVDDYIEEEYLFDNRPEKRVPMTRLRHRIAERLLAAQQNAAILTTFNEVDLTEIKRMRQQYKARFEKVHNSKLGFMSFFVKASTEALKRFPEVNARIDGNDIVYQGYYDIGVAVSTERGLVVPIIKNADQMSYAAIEKKINDYANRARINRLDIEELSGGTFSISNGGVFGSMLSTPILNPPQSAILGMHKIEDRPIVVDGEIVIRPMMYLALSYDHRLIDGKTAVSFLLKIKELLEDPASLLLEL
jgi:2-oxoglutarate dehydrogenase E2 component (dihydrolipoamide succinyltransferase)